MIIWTHRGLPNNENTLEAFRVAYEHGIRYFETDIHATLDGELILSHDVDTKRLISKELHIPSITYDELVRESREEFKWCRLEELLDEFPDVVISIDIKHPHATEHLIKMLKGRELDNLVIGSFSNQRVQYFSSIYPDCTTSLTPLEVLKIKLGVGLSKLKNSPKYAMVPIRSTGITIVSKKFVERCQLLDIPVFVWTVNSTEEKDYLASIGVSGVITDDFKLFL
jgi:glycerophosphoryl diester phosphodiesterase